MDARIERRLGQKDILHVYYNPALRNWDEMVRKALDAHGIKDRRAVLVICTPKVSPKQ